MSTKNDYVFMAILVVSWIIGVWLTVGTFQTQVIWKEETPVEPLVVSEAIEIAELTVVRVPAVIESEPDVEVRYGFTDKDIYLLSQLLCGDAAIDGDGEYDFVWGALHDEMNYYEMSKVLCIVMNRVDCTDGRFPDTVQEVVMQTGQFQDSRNLHTRPSDIALEKVREWCEAYDNWDPGAQSIPENHYFYDGDGAMNHTREVWR